MPFHVRTAVRARLARAFFSLLLLLVPLARDLSASTVIPLTLGDLVRESEAIVVTSVVSAQSRWLDASHRVIVTDCRVTVDDAVAGPAPGTTVVLTFWGGTIGTESQAIAGMPIPRAGERFLMFLRRGALAGGVAPTVGLFQGLLRVEPGGSGQSAVLREADGGALRPLTAGATDFGGLVAYLKAHLEELRNSPVSPALRAVTQAPRAGAAPLPKSQPGRFGVETADSVITRPQADGVAAGDPELPAAPSVRAERSETRSNEVNHGQPSYSWLDGWPGTPIAINPFPASYTPWAPVDQNMLALWNYYSDIFRVRTSSGTYLWPDGINDFAGFLTSSDVSYMYGATWEALGSGVIGVTMIRYVNNRIAEADVMLNAGVSWTLNDEAKFAGTTAAASFRQTMFHEFGHVWGAQHFNDDLSQMGYSYYGQLRGFTLPYTDDAEGVRTLYPAVPRSDLSVHLFRFLAKTKSGSSDFFTHLNATQPSAVNSGDDFTVSGFTVSNAGTTTIATPTIEWYLTAQRNFAAGYYYLGSTSYSSLPRFTRFDTTTISATVHVPGATPTGSYYLAAFIRNDAGPSLSVFPYDNNRSFSLNTISVYHVCALTLGSSSISLRGAAGTSAFPVYVNEGCPWTPVSNASWITITDATGDGNGSVTYRVAANSTGASRTGTISVGGRVFTVTQAASVAPKMWMDAPLNGATVTGPLTIRGWAIDQSAWTGTGVDAVHVYAFPAQGGGGTMIGAATYGTARPDIAALYGAQFSDSGFALTASLAPGTYTIVAYSHNASTNVFDTSRAATVTVAAPVSRGSIAVDAPAPGSIVTSAFEVFGWAIDEGAPSGTGVDAVKLYVQPAGSPAPGVFIGDARYGSARPDIGAIYGSRYASSGFHFTITGLGPGSGQIGVYARSTVTGAFSIVKTVPFSVNGSQLMSVDLPTPETTVAGSSFLVAGWSIDRATAAGTGVDALHVYAYPNPGSGAPPIFLGVAETGIARPDVAAAYGSRYLYSGYALVVDGNALGLAPGVYGIVVHSHSSSGGFNNLATIWVTLQ